jgi:hypothetical protein
LLYASSHALRVSPSAASRWESVGKSGVSATAPALARRKARCQDSRERHCSPGMRVKICKHVQIPDDCVAVALKVTRQAMTVPATARARIGFQRVLLARHPGRQHQHVPGHHTHQTHSTSTGGTSRFPLCLLSNGSQHLSYLCEQVRGAATAPGGGLERTGGA